MSHREGVVDATGSSAFPDLRGVVALVVDDDLDAREIFAASLSHAGAAVLVASSARQALTLVKTRLPHVVITDLSMPGEDGVWLLGQIRSHSPQGTLVPVVVVTGHSHLYSRAEMLAVGFQRYMIKPLDPWLLCGTVRELARTG
jgi:DNA-binding response OmpR family regulator